MPPLPPWKFATQRKNDPTGRNPIFGNFKNEGWSDCQAFVREFLQNTLDNRLKGAGGVPVRASVRFRLLDASAAGLNAEFLKKCLSSLEPHLIAAGLPTTLRNYDDPRALVVEEFETTGFGGPYEDSWAEGDFAGFFHGEANDTKTGGKNGRAGQGKATYNMISHAGALIVLTVREEDDKVLLMGKAAVPRTHQVGEEKYLYRGFWGAWQDDQPLPLAEPNILSVVATAFNLQRTFDQPGSSFVIPFPKPEVSEENITRVVLEEYFYSIIKGRLEVQVGDVLINAATVFDLISDDQFLPQGVAGHEAHSQAFLKFIKEATDLPATRLRKALKSYSGAAISKDLFSEDDFSAIGKDFAAGEILWVRLPIDIHPRTGGKQTSFVDVYLRERDDITRTEEAFIRRDLYISKEKRLKSYFGRAHALVIAEDEPLSECLAYAEVASHLYWNASEEKFVERYKKSTTLAAVRASARRLLEMLQTEDEEVSQDLLLDVISIPGPEGKTKGTNATRKGKKKIKSKQINPPPPRKKYHEVLDGKGIKVQQGPDPIPAGSIPAEAKLEVAYENILSGGNAFANYHPFDFDLADATHSIQASGVTITSRSENVVRFQIEQPEWHLEVGGFDQNKPLRARATVEVAE